MVARALLLKPEVVAAAVAQTAVVVLRAVMVEMAANLAVVAVVVALDPQAAVLAAVVVPAKYGS
jgi:hypothetical protein